MIGPFDACYQAGERPMKIRDTLVDELLAGQSVSGISLTRSEPVRNPGANQHSPVTRPFNA